MVRNVGVNSTFEQQRLVINELAVDVETLENAGYITGYTEQDNLGTVLARGNQATNDILLTGTITATSFVGDGSNLTGISVGAGVTWASAAALRTDNNYTATAGQTTINQSYTAGLIDVYVNGVRLTDSEYTASNGTSIVLNEALFGGESIDVISFTSSGSVSAGAESDTLDTVTGRDGNTTNNINVGILTAKSGVYVDTIRRYTDNSTNTKISLDSGRVKIFAGNGTTPKININGGVGISTNLNVTGVSTFQSDVHTNNGIILTSPNGTEYRLTVDNSGNLSTVAI